MMKYLLSALVSFSLFAKIDGVPQKPLKGERILACIAVNYEDNINDYMTKEKCQKVAERVARSYKMNSRGLLKLKPVSHLLKYPGKAWASWQNAEQEAKRQFKADYYIIPNIFRKGGNHAGGKIAHLTQLTGWLTNHEVGHLLGLGHTGRYVQGKDGKPRLEPYNDKDSFMGNSGVKWLTAPLYYNKGWIPEKEVIEFANAPREYELKKINDFNGKGSSVVVVPPKMIREGGGRPVFVSYPPTCFKKDNSCVALHFFSGGSQLIAKVGEEYWDDDFTDLHIKMTGSTKTTVKFTMDFAPKPVARVQAKMMPDPKEPDVIFELEGDLDHDGIVDLL